MNTIYNKAKKNLSLKNKKENSAVLPLMLDKDILRAVQIQDSLRKKYKAGKNRESVEVVRKFRDKR